MLSQQHRSAQGSSRTSRRPAAFCTSRPVRVGRRANVQVLAFTPGPLKVMISGAPAAGKGTQCAKIVDKYGLVHISVGDLLRDEVKAGTENGKRAKDFMDKGLLVPDDVVVGMVKERLAQDDVRDNGWLLDGYPRSASQAEAIEKVGIRPETFLLIRVPDELLVERVVGRRTDSATGEIYHLKFRPPPEDAIPRLQVRSDDTEDKVKTRLETYHSNVKNVVSYYQDLLVEVDGNRPMSEVFSDICGTLDKLVQQRDPLDQFCMGSPEADECRVYED